MVQFSIASSWLGVRRLYSTNIPSKNNFLSWKSVMGILSSSSSLSFYLSLSLSLPSWCWNPPSLIIKILIKNPLWLFRLEAIKIGRPIRANLTLPKRDKKKKNENKSFFSLGCLTPHLKPPPQKKIISF